MAHSNSDIGDTLMNNLIAKAWLCLRETNTREWIILGLNTMVSLCQPGTEGLRGMNGGQN